jgi:hypothetical protein
LVLNRGYTHWGKIDRSNLRKVAGLDSHILGHTWIGHFISSKCASIFAQNAPNMSIYSSIRRECFRTDLRGVGGGDRTNEIPIAEWERLYRKETQARRLLHQARVLGWGKEKRYYYAHKLS